MKLKTGQSMWLKNIKNPRLSNVNYNDLLFTLLMGIAFFILDQFSPFISDDYFYSLNKSNNEPITSLYDVFISQCYDYTHQNGRFIIHFFTQYFCGILGVGIFRFINSFFFSTLCLLLIIILKERHYSIPNIVIVNLLFICLPSLSLTFLGNISGAINYLWSSVFYLSYIILFTKISNVNSTLNWRSFIFFIYALFCGTLQESFSIGISGYLLLHYIFHRNKINSYQIIIILGFCLGTCFGILSPANFSRFHYTQSIDITHKILVNAFLLLKYGNTFLLLIIITIFSLLNNKNRAINFIINNSIWFGCIFINVLFSIFIALTGKHQLTCIELFSLILLIKWICNSYLPFIQLHYKTITYIGALFFILLYIPIYYYRYQIDKYHSQLIANAKNTTNHIVVAPEYDSFCSTKNNWIVRNFTRQEIYLAFNKIGLSLWLTKGRDKNHIKTILPDTIENIIESCNENTKIQNYIYKSEGKHFYILRIPLSIELGNINLCVYHKSLLGEKKKYAYPITKSTPDSFINKEYQYIIIRESYSNPILELSLSIN